MEHSRIIKELDALIRKNESEGAQLIAARKALSNGNGHARGRRILSKEARQRIAEAQRARWAVYHKQQRKGKKVAA
jgi:hypothetical protein